MSTGRPRVRVRVRVRVTVRVRVRVPLLHVQAAGVRVRGVHLEAAREDVGQLGAVPVPPADGALCRVVEVGAGVQLAW